MLKTKMLRMVACIFMPLTLVTLSHAKTSAPGHWGVDGASGKIEVRGILVESACRLDLSSTYQEIDLGILPVSRFRNVGDFGTPVHFSLMLKDCLRTGARAQDERTGNKIIDGFQPSVNISFLATTVVSNSDLVSVSGTSGLGLEIKDEKNGSVILGYPGQPYILSPGQDSLNYTITPVRTGEHVNVGTFRASIFFYMMYN